MEEPKWGPSGKLVFERTYSRTKPDGSQETWEDTCRRVARGNTKFVEWESEEERQAEENELFAHLYSFKVLPGGRHLWTTGVPGSEHVANCFHAGWGDKLSDHFCWQFIRMMEGGGVGANYSQDWVTGTELNGQKFVVHIVCDPDHPDYQTMVDAGLISTEYVDDWYGCYRVGDSREGWAEALGDLLDTYQRRDVVKHESRVYDVSLVRHKGAPLKTTGGTASGPEPLARMLIETANTLNDVSGSRPTPMQLMQIDHYIAACTVAGGVRRAARMSMLHWRDEHILDFISCKADPMQHWTTNISVEVDDEFWVAVSQHDHEHAAHAGRVLNAVAEGMLANGEPGLFNSSLASERELTRIRCTNPCGEITLEPWESCIIGHVNLQAFVVNGGQDIEGLLRAHRLMTRFLVRATFAPTRSARQAEVVARNRRIGVGHFGVQGFLVQQGQSIGGATLGTRPELQKTLKSFYNEVRDEARRYAFKLRIPEPIKVTTEAPTGSIAKLPGTSEGIHPIFAPYFERRVRFNPADKKQRGQLEQLWAEGYDIEDDVYDSSTQVVVIPTADPLVMLVPTGGKQVEGAEDIPLDIMLLWQSLFQKFYADNAVSFTANLSEDVDLKELLHALRAHGPALKGTTVFPHQSRPQQPYTRITAEQFEAAEAKRVEDSLDLDCSRGGCPIK